MDNIVKAAADTGNINTLTYLLYISIGVIAFLAAAVWLLYRNRNTQRENTVKALVAAADNFNQQAALLKEKEAVTNARLDNMDRQDDIRELRLQEGSRTMRELRDENRKVYDELIKRIAELSTQIATISERNVLSIGGLVNVERFDRYCQSHENKHDSLDREMKNIRESQDEFKLTLITFGTKLDTGIKTMANMISGVVKLGSVENAGTES